MDRTLTLASVGTALGTLNLGIMAMFQEGAIQMLATDEGQILTAWYLLSFLALYQLYRLGTGAASGWSG